MIIFSTIIFSSILALHTVHSLSFQLGTTPGHQCYYITLSKQQKSSGSFEVMTGGDNKVTVQISGPDAQLQVCDFAAPASSCTKAETPTDLDIAHTHACTEHVQ